MLSCLHESVQSAHVCTRCQDLFDASWHRHVAAAEAIDGIFAESIVLFVQLPRLPPLARTLRRRVDSVEAVPPVMNMSLDKVAALALGRVACAPAQRGKVDDKGAGWALSDCQDDNGNDPREGDSGSESGNIEVQWWEEACGGALSKDLRWSVAALCAAIMCKAAQREMRGRRAMQLAAKDGTKAAKLTAEVHRRSRQAHDIQEEPVVLGLDDVEGWDREELDGCHEGVKDEVIGLAPAVEEVDMPKWYMEHMQLVCMSLALDSQTTEALTVMMASPEVLDEEPLQVFIEKVQGGVTSGVAVAAPGAMTSTSTKPDRCHGGRHGSLLLLSTTPAPAMRSEGAGMAGQTGAPWRRDSMGRVVVEDGMGRMAKTVRARGKGEGGGRGGGKESESDSVEQAAVLEQAKGVPWTVCYILLASSVANRHLDARARALLRRLSALLGVPWRWLARAEAVLSEVVIENELAAQGRAQADTSSRRKQPNKYVRAAKVGGVAVVGGTLIGLTGGLAAPAVIAGLGIMGSVVGISATLAVSAGVLGVSFGAAGAGLCGYKMLRRTAELEDFAFDLIDRSPGLPVTLGVPGWLSSSDDSAWRAWDAALCGAASDGGEALALRWETAQLREMGNVVSSFVRSHASSYATSVVGTAVLGATFMSLTWPRTLVSAAGWIDSTWSVSEIRADKAAKELALVLASRVHGHRPVTLVGFGMGARVVFKCLTYLAQMGVTGAGVVETAVCMGTPLPAAPQDWDIAASVCGFRLVNVYSESDWVLAFLYRSSSLSRYVAGLQAVDSPDGSNTVLENVNVTDIVRNHWEYRDKLLTLLKVIGLTSGVSDLFLSDEGVAVGAGGAGADASPLDTRQGQAGRDEV